MHLAQLRERREALDALGVKVLVVVFEVEPGGPSHLEADGVRWPILRDEARTLYAAYGMQRASWWDIWGPATWWAYTKALWKGGRLQHATGDVHQRGGNVLVDPEGIVRLHHVGRGPADRPSIDALLDAVRAR
jgi:hypothetical protein